MYHIKKRPKFVYYYWESDKEYHESTVKDTFWEELCQGKLVLPSGDLYTSIKTMKRKCNAYSLNEEELWWNQVLDSTSDNFVLCGEDALLKKFEKTRKRKSHQIGDTEDEQVVISTTTSITTCTTTGTTDKKKRGRKKKTKKGDQKHMQGDDELGEATSSQVDSEEGASNMGIPETRVIEPMSDDPTMNCSTPSETSCMSTAYAQSQAIGPNDVEPIEQVDDPKTSNKEDAVIQRCESTSAAGVEKFLRGVKEIMAGCNFRTRSSVRNAQKAQENTSKDRQLFQDLATIIPTSRGDAGSSVLGYSTSGSEFEKDPFGPANCKIEIEKQSDSSNDGSHNVAIKQSELGAMTFPFILPSCYVKLEKLDITTTSGNDAKSNTASLTTYNLSTLSSRPNFAIGEYGSVKTISDVKYLHGLLQDDPQSLSDACQLERTRQGYRTTRDVGLKITKVGLKRSASDSILTVQSYRRPKIIFDKMLAALEAEGNASPIANLKNVQPKKRVIGHVIDELSCTQKKMKHNVKRKTGRKKWKRIKTISNTSQEASRDSYLTIDPSSENLETTIDVKVQVEDGAVQMTSQMNFDEENFEVQKPVVIGRGTSNSCRVPIVIENISPVISTAVDDDPEEDVARDQELLSTADIFDCINMEIGNLEIRNVSSVGLDHDMIKLPEKIFEENSKTEPVRPDERTDNPGNVEWKNNDETNIADLVEIDIPPLPPILDNVSVASMTSCLDLVSQGEGASEVIQIPWMENKKKRNQSDPRIVQKKLPIKISSRPPKTKRTAPQYNEKQLLEDCRRKLYQLIMEGVLEEEIDSMETEGRDQEDSTMDSECMEKQRILSYEVSEALGCLNKNSSKSTESNNPDGKIQITVQEPPPSQMKSIRPQDPRRRTDQPIREVETTKDGQKEQDWIESLEGRMVPSFSFLSLRPQQLEMIPVGPVVENIDNAAILDAVKKGDLRVMECVVDNLSSHVHWDLEQVDEMGNTLFMLAAMNDDSQMIMLLRNKVDLNHKNSHKRTPLMVAAQYGKLRTVATLLEMGAHIDSRDYKGKTALLLALDHNQDHVVHLLLGKGANFCPLTLTSNNFKDGEEQERANRIHVCLNSHITWVTKYFDAVVLKYAADLGLKKLRALTAVQFMTPKQTQKFEFTFSYRPDERISDANEDRKVVLFGSQCIIQYNWFDGEIPMRKDLVGGVKCNGIRTPSYEDSAFLLVDVIKGFNVISIGIRPDLLEPRPKYGTSERDKLAFRAYELGMLPAVSNKFARKEIV